MSQQDKANQRVAIVTGAARGIGLAIAVRLAHDGCRVMCMDLPGADWSQVQAATHSAGLRLLQIEADVRSVADWQRVVQETVASFGPPAILVNNAGVAGPVQPLTAYPESSFKFVMDVNVLGSFLGMQHVAQVMEPGGCIVNVASVSGLSGSRNIIAYTASKHAVVGMTKVAALELAGRGIRVNAVCPAPTDTGMVAELERTLSPDAPEAVRARLHDSIPLHRYATPAEIAASVAFLCSADATFITGTTLAVDGGMLAA